MSKLVIFRLCELLAGVLAAVLVSQSLRQTLTPGGSDLRVVKESSQDAVGTDLSAISSVAGAKVFDRGDSGRYLVVAMGACGSCAARSFKPGYELQNQYRKVILVYEGEFAKVVKQAPASAKPPRYCIVADVDGRIHGMLQATYTPRYYEASGDGVITLASANGDEHGKFIK